MIEKELERISKKLFNATMFNFACLMNDAYRDNEKSHVHFHFIPRYKNELKIFDKVYKDRHFGYNFWKWSLSKFKCQNDFGYFIVNNYICIIDHFIDEYGISRNRVIIQNASGKIVLDSIEHRCFPLGNFIKIIHNGESEFLNTLTGEVGQLGISANIDEKGRIDLNSINDISNLLTINCSQLSLPLNNNADPKVKKLLPKKKDD